MQETGYNNLLKIFVQVKANFTVDGQILLRAMIWGKGHRLAIDRVVDCQPRASLRVGWLASAIPLNFAAKDAIVG